MSSVRIELMTEWDSSLLQTRRLQPKGSASVLIGFVSEPDAVDAGLPDLVAQALASGLTAYGVVAGRWFDRGMPLPMEAESYQPQKKNPFLRVLASGFNKGPVPIVITRAASAVVSLLDQGWSAQHQALLVFDPDEAGSRDVALEALSVTRVWTDSALAPPARVLVAPGVDGDFILVAGATKENLKDVLACLASAFRGAGILFPAQP